MASISISFITCELLFLAEDEDIDEMTRLLPTMTMRVQEKVRRKDTPPSSSPLLTRRQIRRSVRLSSKVSSSLLKVLSSSCSQIPIIS
jgi:hypothetical protein